MQWTETHVDLQRVMKRELETMRQLLDNIHLEEQFILRQETHYWGSMMKERADLLEQLSVIHQKRVVVTKQLGAAPLEELLPPQDVNSWEILSLRDQMATLLDRMALQTSRNEMLQHLAVAQPQNKKKIAVATLPLKDYKSENE